jgi:thioredoxin reductase (NADPH)
VEVPLNTDVVGGSGERALEELELRDRLTGKVERRRAEMLFVMIGAVPHTDWLIGALERDRKGFILTGKDLELRDPVTPWPLSRPPMRLETSMPGVFAVGDVRSQSVKRVASAVGEGGVVMQQVHEYLHEIDEQQAPSGIARGEAIDVAPAPSRVAPQRPSVEGRL